ncbi:SseB family protein [Salininema proteolyticum]|uniref:SseB family protein n=1 Tax=Salininema proteolyticum TaxID=1607685 RepID=A0ABV8U2M7_9ACTN
MWEPTTDTENRLREALRAEDQDGYFQILSGTELFLPVAGEQAPDGSDSWATWTSDQRTHVLAFTSEAAMQSCLSAAGPTPAKRLRFADLAAAWPDDQWWLAVNPGLPIEGYLPAWFVAETAQRAQGGDRIFPEAPSVPDVADTAVSPARAPQPPAPSQPAPESTGPLPTAPPKPTIAGETSTGLPKRRPAPESTDASALDAFGSSEPAGPPAQSAPSAADAFGSSAPQSFGSAPSGPDAFGSGAGSAPVAPDPFGSGAGSPAADATGSRPSSDVFGSGPAPSEPAPSGSAADAFGSRPRTDPFATDGPAPDPFASESSTFSDAYGSAGSQQSAQPALPSRTPQTPSTSGPLADSSFPPPPPTPQSPVPPAVPPTPAPVGHRAPETTGSVNSAFERPTASSEFTELTGEAAEKALSEAARSGDTEAFLTALCQTTVLLPVADEAVAHLRVGDPSFRWDSDIVDGIHGITVYTTAERMAERSGPKPHVTVPFGWLAQHWPGSQYALYVNPGTDAGANMSGAEIRTLLNWARSKDLLSFADRLEAGHAREAAAALAEERRRRAPREWQKLLPHHQVPYYLERGYDRVAGHINLVDDVADQTSPAALYAALQLSYATGEFNPNDDEAHVIRWTGYRTALYSEPRSNPAGADVYSVHSVHLPHGASMHRLTAAGAVTEVARFDSDRRAWVPSGAATPAIEASEHPLDQRQATQWGGI